MSRASQMEADKNRAHIVETASRVFRRNGLSASVSDVMGEAGFTNGGFYKNFDSKDALLKEAISSAFENLATEHRQIKLSNNDDSASARTAIIKAYLSQNHCEGISSGCPLAALSVDIARTKISSEMDRIFAEAIKGFAKEIEGEEDGLVTLATLVGAVILARATASQPVSKEILSRTRKHLLN